MIHNYFSKYSLVLLLLWNIVLFSSSSLCSTKICTHHNSDQYPQQQQSYGAIQLQGHASLIPQYSSYTSLINPVENDRKKLDPISESASDLHRIVVNPTQTLNNNNNKHKRSQPITTTTTTSTTVTTDPIYSNQNQSPTSLLTSTQNFPSIENLLTDRNFTNFLENGDSYLQQNSPLFSSYFVPTSTGSLYPVDFNNILPLPLSASTNHQYGQYYYHTRPYSKNNNRNKTIGLGRRIGELVSNSAERATRAFKSFPKLLNDIKPSKLLGLSSSEPDLTTTKHNISSIPLPSSWYLPQNTWSSFAPPPITSSLYLQQPVFVRTQDMTSSSPTIHSSPIQTNNQILNPSSSSGIKSSAEFNSISPNRFINTANGQQNVYPSDLYASAQTSYGNRVKPPRDQYPEFDISGEDGMVTDQDQDTKMANEGQMDNGEDHRNNNNNSGPIQNDYVSHDNNGWHHSGSQPYEEYVESGTTDYYNHQTSFNPNNNGVRFPNNNIRRPPFPQNFRPTSYNRRPYSMSEIEEIENWYPSFFGPNVKPINRLRNVPFNSPSFSQYSAANSLLNPTTIPTVSTGSEYMPFMQTIRPSETSLAASQFYPIATAPITGPRSTWSSVGYYPNFSSANQFYNYHRPNTMMTVGSMIRPMTIPFFPSINNYYMQRYRSFPYVGPYGAYQPAAAPLNPMMSTQPYRYNQSPFNSLVAAASSLYPVRVPFPPISPPLSYSTIIPAPITHIPVLKHRIGQSLVATSQRPNKGLLWKRNEVAGKRSDKLENNNINQQQNINRKQDNSTYNKYNESNRLAELYNSYQMFQKQLNTVTTSNKHQSDYYFDQSPTEYHQYFMNHTNESSSSPRVMITPTILPPLDFVENLSSLSSSTNNQTKTFRSMRAHRHIDKRDQINDESGTESSLVKSSLTNDAKTSILKQRKQQQKQKQGEDIEILMSSSTDYPTSMTNEWKPVFKTFIKRTTNSNSLKH